MYLLTGGDGPEAYPQYTNDASYDYNDNTTFYKDAKFCLEDDDLDHFISAGKRLKARKRRVFITEGDLGSYFFLDENGEKIAVFKPNDEEKGSHSNPINHNNPIDQGFIISGGCYREVAVYTLDSFLSQNFKVRVPPTILIKCLHGSFNYMAGDLFSKRGSLQKYISNAHSGGDFNDEEVWADIKALDVDDVYTLTVFDMLIGKLDRSDENILLHGQNAIPINHGCYYPLDFFVMDLCWVYWNQASYQFSENIKEFIKSIDAHADIQLMKSLGVELSLKQEVAVHVGISLLKFGVDADLTAHDIGSFMYSYKENDRDVRAFAFQILMWDVFGALNMKDGCDTPPSADMESVILGKVRDLIDTFQLGRENLDDYLKKKRRVDYKDNIDELIKKYSSKNIIEDDVDVDVLGDGVKHGDGASDFFDDGVEHDDGVEA